MTEALVTGVRWGRRYNDLVGGSRSQEVGVEGGQQNPKSLGTPVRETGRPILNLGYIF